MQSEEQDAASPAQAHGPRQCPTCQKDAIRIDSFSTLRERHERRWCPDGHTWVRVIKTVVL